MYAQDARRIQKWARKSPENLTEVILFVLLSIRQPIEKVPAMLAHVREHGDGSKYLRMGSKREGYLYARKHSEKLFRECLRAWRRKDDIRLLLTLTEIPGLGLVKAGFVGQLAFGRTGCLDIHNLRRFKLDPRDFQLGGVSEDTARERAKLYAETCESLGGCEQLWDSWCEYLADLRYGQEDMFERLRPAERISQLHLAVMESAV